MSKKEHSHTYDDLMKQFYKQVGEAHIENIIAELEEKQDEINQVQISDSLENWIKKEANKIRRKEFYRRLTSRASLIALLLISSLAVVTFTVEAVRVQLYNLVLESNERYTSISYDTDISYGIINDSDARRYYPTYVPAGYTLSDEKKSGNVLITTYAKGDNEIKVIESSLKGNTKLDTENAEIIDVDIQGNPGMLILKEEHVILHWANQEAAFEIIAYIEPAEVLQMAKSMTK